MKKPNTWGLAISLTGLMAVLLTVILDERLKPPGHITSITLGFFEHLGVALIILGLVGIIVDFDDWQKYFQERLAETIVKRDYLRTLDEPELLSLQTDTLKAFFQVDDIDRKGSFLEYFHTRIRDFIGSPYREDAYAIMSITHTDSRDLLQVEDSITYKCRKVGDFIQDDIMWFNEPGEVKEVLDFKVVVQIPKNFFQSPEFKTRYPQATEHPIVFERNDERLEAADEGIGFKLSLNDYKDIDGLKVKIYAKYIFEKNRFLVWKMTHPSNRLMMTFTYPADLDFSIESFGIASNDLEQESKDGFHSLKYDSWLLPDNGFIFQFRDRDTAPVKELLDGVSIEEKAHAD
ncbi:MAG TPA: hypothetical protein VNO50_11830 [Pyrinomonadaceae bacterium]|nr:hypothetical protein [Pyrinomonadaceae bacterium]